MIPGIRAQMGREKEGSMWGGSHPCSYHICIFLERESASPILGGGDGAEQTRRCRRDGTAWKDGKPPLEERRRGGEEERRRGGVSGRRREAETGMNKSKLLLWPLVRPRKKHCTPVVHEGDVLEHAPTCHIAFVTPGGGAAVVSGALTLQPGGAASPPSSGAEGCRPLTPEYTPTSGEPRAQRQCGAERRRRCSKAGEALQVWSRRRLLIYEERGWPSLNCGKHSDVFSGLLNHFRDPTMKWTTQGGRWEADHNGQSHNLLHRIPM
ncbi:hypothetical protein EYF80_059122 [Liparis tanakae]|uniref:Uncharacterized protein n=1 Tax=Liparis tanakae TaxID=230148 RepID=A0A4Z2EP99_9TELE|nr:hypothetical protein EYF80_059122 [Liparis tanakae]